MSLELLESTMHLWKRAFPSTCYFPIAPIPRNWLASSKDKKTSFGGRKKPSAEKLSRPRLPSGSRLLDECWGRMAFFFLNQKKTFERYRCGAPDAETTWMLLWMQAFPAAFISFQHTALLPCHPFQKIKRPSLEVEKRLRQKSFVGRDVERELGPDGIFSALAFF